MSHCHSTDNCIFDRLKDNTGHCLQTSRDNFHYSYCNYYYCKGIHTKNHTEKRTAPADRWLGKETNKVSADTNTGYCSSYIERYTGCKDIGCYCTCLDYNNLGCIHTNSCEKRKQKKAKSKKH